MSELALAVAETHRSIMEAYHQERRQLSDRIFALEALLAEHGIPLPSQDTRLGGDPLAHHAACMAVVNSAYDLLANLEALKTMIGSSMEFVGQPRWKDPAPDLTVLGLCPHGVDLDLLSCPEGCRV